MRVLILLALIVTPSPSAAALVTPSNLTATAISGTTINLTWAESRARRCGISPRSVRRRPRRGRAGVLVRRQPARARGAGGGRGAASPPPPAAPLPREGQKSRLRRAA